MARKLPEDFACDDHQEGARRESRFVTRTFPIRGLRLRAR